MTIHSDWARVLHDECPQAFTKQIPKGAQPQVGVIDGHLQLMRIHHALFTWDNVVDCLFAKPVRRLFDAGCSTVIMCFDSYDSVPVYKSMTQTSRASKHEVRVFHAHDSLPQRVPEDTMLFLMNRTFKLKVIELACTRLPALVTLKEGQTLIVDYKRAVSYTATSGAVPSDLLTDIACMGESDVKFCRYVTRFGNALVHAIDGDYMAIALLYYVQNGLRPNNKIFIFRHAASFDKPAGEKRKRAAKPDDTKCWVDMQLLYIAVARRVQITCGGTMDPFSEADAVYSAVFLMLSAGTDFSRGLPQIGPKRIWDALPTLVVSLLQAVRGSEAVDATLFSNAVVGTLYCGIYEKHLGPSRGGGLQPVLSALARSKLADSTKKRLPTVGRVLTTIRNLAWVMKYWTMENGQVETPLNDEYGFTRDEEGQVVFSDAMALTAAADDDAE